MPPPEPPARERKKEGSCHARNPPNDSPAGRRPIHEHPPAESLTSPRPAWQRGGGRELVGVGRRANPAAAATVNGLIGVLGERVGEISKA
jgi:hypothetical protein